MKSMGEVLAASRAKLQHEILEIENRKDLTDDEKVEKIIWVFSSVCAGVAIQPIPFADIFLLTPIQAFMGTRISAIRGLSLSEREVSDVIKEIAGVVGLGLLAQQLALGAYKTFVPFLAGLTTIPLVLGLSYGIGKVMDMYFINRVKGRRMSKEEIKDAWKKARAERSKHQKPTAAEVKRAAREAL